MDVGSIGEFVGSACKAFLTHRQRTKRRSIIRHKTDIDISYHYMVNEGLGKDCAPLEDHVSRIGLKKVCQALKNKDQFKAQLAIDANPGLNKRQICVVMLKGVATYLCTEDPSEIIRAATYTMIACR